MDLIWGEAAPPTAATGLQGYVSQLRKAIEPDRSRPTVIVTVGAGYVARVGPEQLDVARFEQLTARAREASSPQDAADVLAKALALWRGRDWAVTARSPLSSRRWSPSTRCASACVGS